MKIETRTKRGARVGRLVFMLRGWGAAAAVYVISGLLPLGRAATLPLTPLDALLGPHPASVWVYLSFFPLVFLSYFKAERELLPRLARASQLVAAVSAAVFIFWPSAVPAEATPDLSAGLSGYLEHLVRLLDTRRNCLPSLHGSLTVLSLAALCSRRRPFRSLWLIFWGLAVMASAVSLRQHVAVDIGAGALLGFLAAGATGLCGRGFRPLCPARS